MLPSHIKRAFRDSFRCSIDVAALLSTVCSCDGHVPTGSCLSMAIAYYAHKQLLDGIYVRCVSEGITMTCYVDDWTFSGMAVSPEWCHNNVRLPIHKAGLRTHKTKFYRANQPKDITGVIIDGNVTKVCNRHHKAIDKLLADLAVCESEEEMDGLYRKLRGRFCAAAQIEESFAQRAKRSRHRASYASCLPDTKHSKSHQSEACTP